MFVECKKVKNVLHYFKDILFKVCKIKNKDIASILHLDFKANRKENNTAVILTTSYIGCIWYNRAKTICIEDHIYKSYLLKHHHILSLILKDNMSRTFNENICNIADIT